MSEIKDSRDYYRRLNNDSLIPEISGKICYTPDQMIWFAEKYHEFMQMKANGAKSENANCAIFDVMAILPTTNDMETYKGHRSECFKGEYMFGLQTGIENCFEWIKDWIRAKADGNLPNVQYNKRLKLTLI